MAEINWYVQIMGSEVGPFTSSQLKDKAAKGQIERSTLVRKAGSTAWTEASKIKGLFPDLPSTTQSPVPDPEPLIEPEPAQTTSRNNPYAVSLQSTRGGSVKTPRKYPALEFYAVLLKALAIIAAIVGVLGALILGGIGVSQGVYSTLGVSFVILLYAAVTAFGLLLASELIKMSLDVASDIKHIADQQ